MEFLDQVVGDVLDDAVEDVVNGGMEQEEGNNQRTKVYGLIRRPADRGLTVGSLQETALEALEGCLLQ